MIASVTIAPRTSLAMCRGGLQGSPKLLTAARSLVNCRNCRRSQRAALPRDLTPRWIPRRRWQEPHPRTPSRSPGSENRSQGHRQGCNFGCSSTPCDTVQPRPAKDAGPAQTDPNCRDPSCKCGWLTPRAGPGRDGRLVGGAPSIDLC
jgi:hypothetical protein